MWRRGRAVIVLLLTGSRTAAAECLRLTRAKRRPTPTARAPRAPEMRGWGFREPERRRARDPWDGTALGAPYPSETREQFEREWRGTVRCPHPWNDGSR